MSVKNVYVVLALLNLALGITRAINGGSPINVNLIAVIVLIVGIGLN